MWFPSARQPNERRTTPTVRLTAAHSAPTQLEAIGAPSAFARPSASLTLPTCALYRSAVGGVKAEDCTTTSTDATCVACQASLISFVLSCSSPSCVGAAQAAPALFVALAAVANHFLA